MKNDEPVTEEERNSRHVEQFRRMVWKVHHEGQRMPGRTPKRSRANDNARNNGNDDNDNKSDDGDDDDDDADLVVERANAELDIKCPISMTIMVDPVKK
jgi:hypothetical protein